VRTGSLFFFSGAFDKPDSLDIAAVEVFIQLFCKHLGSLADAWVRFADVDRS